jgi:predicted patatin/cPLA2 family phospholipase
MNGQSGAEDFEMRQSGALRVGGDRLQILSLSGGGYRGLYTAAVLEHLETRAKRPLSEIFDLVAGTSIGGIIAIGIAAGVPMSAIRAAFEARGDDIFARSQNAGPFILPRLRMGVLREKYSSQGLADTIDEVLASATNVAYSSQAKTGLLVTAVNVTSYKPKIFRSYFGEPHTSLRDLALATSAAPTYFPEHAIGEDNFVDGGLIANAPDLVAINDCLRAGYGHDDIRMLSIGTVGTLRGTPPRKPRGAGKLSDAKRLFELVLTAQQSLAVEQSRLVLGDDNYLRIDAIASSDQMAAIALDKAGKRATDTLRSLANATVDEQINPHGTFFNQLFNHSRGRGLE